MKRCQTYLCCHPFVSLLLCHIAKENLNTDCCVVSSTPSKGERQKLALFPHAAPRPSTFISAAAPSAPFLRRMNDHFSRQLKRHGLRQKMLVVYLLLLVSVNSIGVGLRKIKQPQLNLQLFLPLYLWPVAKSRLAKKLIFSNSKIVKNK